MIRLLRPRRVRPGTGNLIDPRRESRSLGGGRNGRLFIFPLRRNPRRLGHVFNMVDDFPVVEAVVRDRKRIGARLAWAADKLGDGDTEVAARIEDHANELREGY